MALFRITATKDMEQPKSGRMTPNMEHIPEHFPSCFRRNN